MCAWGGERINFLLKLQKFNLKQKGFQISQKFAVYMPQAKRREAMHCKLLTSILRVYYMQNIPHNHDLLYYIIRA